MDNRDLKVFLHLSKSLHFTKTSNEFFLSTSSLTRQVQRMEAEIGTLLFERDNRTVKLTHAGELFREYALESVARWDAMQQGLQQQTASLTGRISVFCSLTAREPLNKSMATLRESGAR
jgi:LysR family transcriptional regulator, positive regulator for ilvC